ncbi:T9SS type A sorting domain-containing protein [Nonlabens marinus]|uniref:Secretion system C-terminal sorting domain-containing protein n=1 Tax=Nonlabens marinus S1-08 TaxID=1454201 RepID=W8W028_9FLAO|nr:T9SS type A sorting domain-containing protein [Nonlabens marinus]BAO55601.1 hypothetical protein NMS_1592 [Nonlabens marinus S1-08]
MKKITLLIASIAMVTTSMAQVHVVNDAFIYSKGTDIFITEELELRDAPVVDDAVPANNRPGSAFYLREGGDASGDGNGRIAQLIQQNSNSSNIGLGTFSVFQEGFADNFTYNYWSSPVSLPNATTANNGFSYTQLYFPKLMETFKFETDYVIDAEQATYLSSNLRDGKTDSQRFTDMTDLDNPKDPVVDSKLQIAKRWLYSYKSADPSDAAGVTGGGYFGWKSFQADTDVVAPGYGFTMKGVELTNGPNLITNNQSHTGQRYDFRGIPNNGDFPVSVKNGDFSLVGNPYPSGLDLKQFMIDNQGLIDGELFFWDSASTSHLLIEYEGGYGTYSPQIGSTDPNESNGVYVDAVFKKYDQQGNEIGDATTNNTGLSGPVGNANFASRRYAAIGQGFVIQRTLDDPSTEVKDGFTSLDDGDSGTVVFKNSQRVFVKENGDSSLFKAAPSNAGDQVANINAANIPSAMSFEVLINGQYSRNMIVTFPQGSTVGWDWGMDASNVANRVANDAYMPVEGRQALIQSLPFNELETVIPISFKSSIDKSTYKIQITGRENFETLNVLIHDKLNNSYHDILNDSYTIETGKGTTEDRYEIVFQEKTTLSTSDIAAVESFNIFQNNEQSLLTVRNTAMKDVANIAIFDLAGRQVTTSNPKDISADYTFNTTAYAAGIYIVKVTTTDKVEVATKVVISN